MTLEARVHNPVRRLKMVLFGCFAVEGERQIEYGSEPVVLIGEDQYRVDPSDHVREEACWAGADSVDNEHVVVEAFKPDIFVGEVFLLASGPAGEDLSIWAEYHIVVHSVSRPRCMYPEAPEVFWGEFALEDGKDLGF